MSNPNSDTKPAPKSEKDRAGVPIAGGHPDTRYIDYTKKASK